MTERFSSSKVAGGIREDPPAPPRIAVASENYGRIYRMLEKKVPVTLQLDIENKFYDDDLNSFNIIGEIPGTDKAKPTRSSCSARTSIPGMRAPVRRTTAQAPP